jgi:hypothetical protein
VHENSGTPQNPAAREKDRVPAQLDDDIIDTISTGAPPFLLVAGSRRFEEALRRSLLIMDDELNTHDDAAAMVMGINNQSKPFQGRNEGDSKCMRQRRYILSIATENSKPTYEMHWKRKEAQAQA